MQGYNKYRRALFQKENLIPKDGTEKEKHTDEKKNTEALVGALSLDAGDNKGKKSFDFHSKEDCSKVRTNFVSAHKSVHESVLVYIISIFSNVTSTCIQTEFEGT